MDGTSATEQRLQRIEEGFLRIEQFLGALIERERVKDNYTTEEFASAVGRAPFTVREWCRLGRIRATKKTTLRGPHEDWVIAHEELLRYRREGLLPLPGVVGRS